MLGRWNDKFACAFRGLREGVRGGTSFVAHFFIAIVVIAAAAATRMRPVEWCVLLLCITVVFAAELFNTALEAMARAVTRETNPHIRDALDIAAAAVLTVAAGSVVVGVVLFGSRLWQLLQM